MEVPDVKTNEHGDGGRPQAAENFCFSGVPKGKG